MTEVKTRKPRTPRNTESVTKGALALPLQERVALRNKISESIIAEVETLKAEATQAEKFAGEVS